MFDSEGGVVRRPVQPGTAMDRYLALCELSDVIEAAKADALTGVLDEYEWPENEPIPSRPDVYGARRVGDRWIGEDLCLEIAAANRTSVGAARGLLGAVEEISHKLPGCWGAVVGARAPLWQARRILDACVELDAERCVLVDEVAAPALGAFGMGKLMRLVNAAVKAADPDGERRRAARGGARFVRIDGDADDCLSSWVMARLDRGDAIFLDATIQLIADRLTDPALTVDLRRAKAFGMLANPARIVAELGVWTTRGMDPAPACPADVDAVIAQAESLTPSLVPQTQIYVHTYEDDLGDLDAVARVEKIGPVLLDQVKQLTGATIVKVSRIIHVGPGTVPVDAYEVPYRMREQVLARDGCSVFPYSSIEGRGLDLDHTIDYRADGPPGQTRPDNLGILERSAHRAKTVAGWRLQQPRPGVFIWCTPAGQHFRTDHTGTHRLPDDGT